MSKYRGVARDEYGNSLNAATVTVYDPGTTTLSTIYSDSALSVAETNPLSAGADGTYTFYATPGYYDVQVAKAGYTTVELEDEIIGGVMAECSGVALGSFSPGVTPDEIGNTALGAAHLVAGTVSNVFTVDVAAGTYTYSGNEKITVLALMNLTCSLGTTPNVFGAYIYKNFDTSATVVAQATQTASSAAIHSVSCFGITTLEDGDEMSFAANSPTGGVVTMATSDYVIMRVA